MAQSDKNLVSLAAAEHIGPTETGDNIDAKKVAGYSWDGSNWVRTPSTMGKLVTEKFDYIAATYPDTSTEVYTYKSGGSGGTTVATVTVAYSDAVTKQIITSVTKT